MESRNQSLLRTIIYSLTHKCTFSILRGTVHRSQFWNVHLCVVLFLIHGLPVRTMVTKGVSRNDALFIEIIYINALVILFSVLPHGFSYQSIR
jgi:uncharacterized membrane protein YhaH (DUF805 family)